MLRSRNPKAGTAGCDGGDEETRLAQHQAGAVVEGGDDVGVDLAVVLIPGLFGLGDGVFRMGRELSVKTTQQTVFCPEHRFSIMSCQSYKKV